MSEQLELQLSLLSSITRALSNFKKFGKKNYTPAIIRSRMNTLKDTWQQCRNGYAALLSLYPPAKRDSIPYFANAEMDAHKETYQMTQDHMAESLEELEPCVSANQSLINSSMSRADVSSLSLKHLPPIKLPPFSGEVSERRLFAIDSTRLSCKTPNSQISLECTFWWLA